MDTKYNVVKEYYDGGFWNERRVRDAVLKNWISADEFRTITGKKY